MVEKLPVGTETKTIGDFDSIPEFCDRSIRIDSEKTAGTRLAVARKRIEVQRARKDAALIIRGQIIQSHQRLAFPAAKDIAAFAGRFIPHRQAPSGDYEPTRFVQRDSADASTLWDKCLD